MGIGDSTIMTEIKQVKLPEPDKRPIFWKLLIFLSPPALVFGVICVYLGWNNMNHIEQWGNTVDSIQVGVSTGIGIIGIGIAAIILGGIGVIVDVLSKTGNK
jgi:hypothetical protein